MTNYLFAGYCFLLFQDEMSVQALIEACLVEDSKLYWCVSSPTMKDKPVSYLCQHIISFFYWGYPCCMCTIINVSNDKALMFRWFCAPGSNTAVESCRFGLRYGRVTTLRSSENNICRWCAQAFTSRYKLILALSLTQGKTLSLIKPIVVGHFFSSLSDRLQAY